MTGARNIYISVDLISSRDLGSLVRFRLSSRISMQRSRAIAASWMSSIVK